MLFQTTIVNTDNIFYCCLVYCIPLFVVVHLLLALLQLQHWLIVVVGQCCAQAIMASHVLAFIMLYKYPQVSHITFVEGVRNVELMTFTIVRSCLCPDMKTIVRKCSIMFLLHKSCIASVLFLQRIWCRVLLLPSE